DLSGYLDVSTLVLTGEEGTSAVQAVGLVRGGTLVHGGLVHAVTQHVVDGCVRTVDRQLGEVGSAEPHELGVQVGEQPSGQQWVIGDVDPGHQVTGVEGDLLGLGEVVGRVGV